MKAVEETVARRIADSILETRQYPYDSQIIDKILPLRTYHDLIYEHAIANSLRDVVYPGADGVIQVLKIVLDGLYDKPKEAPAPEPATTDVKAAATNIQIKSGDGVKVTVSAV
jgi:hypothetical protein